MTKYTYDSIKNEVEDRLIACYRDIAMLYDMAAKIIKHLSLKMKLSQYPNYMKS